jgi:GNAT superfamily N-acetyltransferase
MININNHLSLKTITASDQKDLYALMRRIYPPAYQHLWDHGDCSFYLNKFYSPENLELELQEPDSEYYFILYNDNRSGVLRLQHNTSFTHKSIDTYLNRIYLGEEAQGKGLAKLICDWSEGRAKENFSKSIWLKAMDTQRQALKFYKKQGYKFVGKTSLDFSLLKIDLRGMVILQKTL